MLFLSACVQTLYLPERLYRLLFCKKTNENKALVRTQDLRLALFLTTKANSGGPWKTLVENYFNSFSLKVVSAIFNNVLFLNVLFGNLSLLQGNAGCSMQYANARCAPQDTLRMAPWHLRHLEQAARLLLSCPLQTRQPRLQTRVIAHLTGL